MPLVTKTTHKWGFLLAQESTYGTAVSLSTASDGFRCYAPPNVKVHHAYDGQRPGKSPGTRARTSRVGAEGRWGEATIQMELAGKGLGTESVIQRLFQAAGMKFAGAAYTPGDDVDFLSYSASIFEYGEQYDLQGCFADGWEITAEFGKIATVKSMLKGIMAAAPVDATIPTITYNPTVGAKAVQTTLSLGGFIPLRVLKMVIKQKLALVERAWDNANGRHGGFYFDEKRDYTVECDIECPPKTTSTPWFDANSFNAHVLQETGGAFTLNATIGGTTGNTFAIAAPKAQVAEPAYDKKGSIAIIKLSLDLMPTSETSDDEISIAES